MNGLRPIAVALQGESLDMLAYSHKFGCDLTGFAHLFHPGKSTDDDSDHHDLIWKDEASKPDDTELNPELRTKLRNDGPLPNEGIENSDESASAGCGEDIATNLEAGILEGDDGEAAEGEAADDEVQQRFEEISSDSGSISHSIISISICSTVSSRAHLSILTHSCM